MGAKASTSGNQSPRSRTFSSSSAGADTAATAGGLAGARGESSSQGYNLLRTLPGLQIQNHSQDRQRARSLTSVPDIHQQGGSSSHTTAAATGGGGNSNASQRYDNFIHQHYAIEDSNRDSPPVTIGNGFLFDHPLMLNSESGSSRLHANTLNFEELQASTAAGTNFVESIALAASAASSEDGSIGRVYTATSLPSHIWSFNGIKCPVCNKFVLPDEIECHLVMCLTKPRLSYNEDVLGDAKGECVICLEDLNPGDIIARLPCLCVYHKGCIDRWFEVNRCCPEHPGD